MHMADALLSPAVGGTMWAATAGTIAYCSKKVREEMDDKKIPLMGVLGAFIFASQMINFSIPATGSSGHLGGGMILAILLGPYAAFLTIASVLVVQALFFADGGLLALGCNIFNLGFFPAFIVYPFIYKKIVGSNASQRKITIAAIISAIISLQLGAFGVVLETTTSGISSLPFSAFLTLMQPIHLGIGIVEGLVTAAVINFIYKARPEIVLNASISESTPGLSIRSIVTALLAVALLTGGVISWFASKDPDGLEWSIKKVTGKEEVEGTPVGIHATLAELQEHLSFMPDYSFKEAEAVKKNEAIAADISSQYGAAAITQKEEEGNKFGTSVAGIVGGIMTLILAFAIGTALKKFSTTQAH